MKFNLTILLLFGFLIHDFQVQGKKIPPWNIQIPSKEIESLREMIKPCSEVAQMYDIVADDGTSKTPGGNKLTVVVLGINKDRHVFGVPEVRMVGNLHGNEFIGMEVVKTAVEFFCSSYTKFMKAREPLDTASADMLHYLNTTRLHLLPIANPDGMETFVEAYQRKEAEKYKGFTYGRNNSNGFDLNRNFELDIQRMAEEQGVPKNEIREPTNTKPLQPETKMLMSWMRSEPFVASLNFHGGEFLASYPFDAARADGRPGVSLTGDPQLVYTLARLYMDSYLSYVKRRQCYKSTKTDKGVTNGAGWYPFDGSMTDFSYLQTQCIDLTVESSCEKFPTIYPRFQRNAQLHLLTVLKYLKIVHWGIKGRVSSNTGKYMQATFRIVHLSADIPYISRRITKSGLNGEFHRLLLRGRYAVVASSPGFKTRVICTTVTNKDTFTAKKINLMLVKGKSRLQIYSSCEAKEKKTIKNLLRK